MCHHATGIVGRQAGAFICKVRFFLFEGHLAVDGEQVTARNPEDNVSPILVPAEGADVKQQEFQAEAFP